MLFSPLFWQLSLVELWIQKTGENSAKKFINWVKLSSLFSFLNKVCNFFMKFSTNPLPHNSVRRPISTEVNNYSYHLTLYVEILGEGRTVWKTDSLRISSILGTLQVYNGIFAYIYLFSLRTLCLTPQNWTQLKSSPTN